MRLDECERRVQVSVVNELNVITRGAFDADSFSGLAEWSRLVAPVIGLG